MPDISTIRHQSIFDPVKYNIPINLIGCGAIGSRIFMSLIELGLTRITCFDDDVVEPHNLANQAFHYSMIGHNKVEMLDILYSMKTAREVPNTMVFVPGRVPHPDHRATGLVFLAVDTFAARKEIVDSIAFNPDVLYVIDTRMGAMHGNVISFDPNSRTEVNAYFSTLGSDEPEAAELSPCGTSLSVGPTAAIIANLAVWQMITKLTNPIAHEKFIEIVLRPNLFINREFV